MSGEAQSWAPKRGDARPPCDTASTERCRWQRAVAVLCDVARSREAAGRTVARPAEWITWIGAKRIGVLVSSVFF